LILEVVSVRINENNEVHIGHLEVPHFTCLGRQA